MPREVFGIPDGATHVIPAYWQSIWNAIPQIASGIGGYAAGPLSDRLSRRATFIIAGLFSCTGVAVVYTSSTRGVFLTGKIVNAIGFGIGRLSS